MKNCFLTNTRIASHLSCVGYLLRIYSIFAICHIIIFKFYLLPATDIESCLPERLYDGRGLLINHSVNHS